MDLFHRMPSLCTASIFGVKRPSKIRRISFCHNERSLSKAKLLHQSNPDTSAPLVQSSCALVSAFLEILANIITGPHGKRDDWHRGGLISRGRKNARIADVEIRNLVSLRPLICDRRLGIVPHPADPDFMQTGSGPIGLVVGAPHLRAHRLEEINHHLLRVFPHQKFVVAPLEMKSELRNSENV